jgi:type II secretory pathway pseudopilin PulG
MRLRLNSNSPVISARSGRRKPPVHGFTLVEALITVGLAAILLAVFTAVLTSTVFLKRAQYSVLASNFIQEELDSLRTLPYAELLTRTNGNFLGVSMTRGPWKVKTDASVSPPSGTKVFAMETAQAAVIQETGLAVLPGNSSKDANVIAKIRVRSASPAGWGAGIAFHYRDAENHYRFRFTSGGIALDKVRQGTVTTLWSQSAAYSTGTWYTLEVDIVGNAYTLKKNGATLTTYTDATETYLTKGANALLTMNGGLVYADDVSVYENSATTSWNFDGDADGSVPADWQRLSAVDLPSGAATLTVANYLGDSNIKQATVNITWSDLGITRSATGSTLIAK